MITIAKLKIYDKYHGDGDMWSRLVTDEEKTILKYPDWRLIEDLVQGVILIKTNTVSKEYKDETQLELLKNCSSTEVIDYIEEIAHGV
jgi:hypothetical protein